jgi:hypothetical protein
MPAGGREAFAEEAAALSAMLLEQRHMHEQAEWL